VVVARRQDCRGGAPVHCRGESGAVASDRRRGRRSEQSSVVWSSRQSVQQRRTLCEGEASGVPRREKCSEQSAGALLLEKRGRRVGWWRGTKERMELC
jgi:hypothetical protein